jgi:hypothetical protein
VCAAVPVALNTDKHTHTHTTTTQNGFLLFCVFVAADKQTNKQHAHKQMQVALERAQTPTSKRAAKRQKTERNRLQRNKQKATNKRHTHTSKAKMCGVPHTTRRKQTQTNNTHTNCPVNYTRENNTQTRKNTCFASSNPCCQTNKQSKQSDGLWVVGPSRVWELLLCNKQTNKQNDTTNKQTNKTNTDARSQMRQENPLNLSILISGGKETNKDSLSNGE